MFVAPLAVLALAASACGSDSKSATTTAAGAATTAAAAATTAAGGDCSAKIGFMGPFTGDAASIGQEQLNWGKLGLADFNKANGTSFTFVETDTKLDPAEATTGGQKLVSDAGVVAILGPAGSQEVEAVGPAMTGAGLVCLAVGHSYEPDDRRQAADVRPRRPERRRTGADGRQVRQGCRQGQQGPDHR